MLSERHSLFSTGPAGKRVKPFSTIKLYLAAISACHIGLGDKPAGQHPLVCRFNVNRTASFRGTDQLFVSWATPHKGKPLSRQRLSTLDCGGYSASLQVQGHVDPCRFESSLHQEHGYVMGSV